MSNPKRHSKPALPARRRRLALLASVALLATPVGAVAVAHAAAAPRVVSESWSSHETSAVLRGTINPEGEATEYRFQYVTQAQWEAEGFKGASSVPVPPGSLPAGAEAVEVHAILTGLAPASAYRFRLLAHNPLGYGVGEALAFRTLAAEAAPGGPCPNEAFRTGQPSAALPDCRAYEQASPVDKNGGNVGASVDLTKASLGGDGITFEGQALPGGDGTQAFPIYMASREGGEWVTRGLLPPASENEYGNVFGWTPDLAWTFDLGSQSNDLTALLARPRLSNPIAALAPYTAHEPIYVIGGASADDSTILFSAGPQQFGPKAPPLPVKAGDPAPAVGKPNVYAWDRETEELSLAGVLPDGTVPAQGTGFIIGYTQEMRAVAADGSVFFLDKGTKRLYLREHPTEAESAKDGEGECTEPAMACTLAVSASQRTTPDPESFEPTFRAASTDGSAAFFSSKQELTDDADTIAKPELIGRADVSGEEATEAQGDFIEGPNVSALAADASHLYWVNTATSTIGRSNLNGDEEEPSCISLPEIEVAAGVFASAHPKGIAVGVGADEGHLYWSNAANEAEGKGTIGRAEIHATCAEMQASVEQGLVVGATDPRGIDTDGAYLYWCNTGEQSTRAVGRAGIDGAAPNQKFADVGDINKPRDVVADPVHDHLYVARGAGGEIVQVNLGDGGGRVSLPGEAQSIALRGSRLYWAQEISESGKTENIVSSNLEGEEVETEFVPVEAPVGIAFGKGPDSDHLYWGAHPSGRGEDLYRFDAKTGELTDIALPQRSVKGADVQGLLGASEDGTYLYFAANGSFDGAPEGGCRKEGGTTTGVCNLYLWHEEDPETHAGQVTFIARLLGSDSPDWATSQPPHLNAFPQKTARVSADGRTVLFVSTRRLTSYDNSSEACAGGFSHEAAPCAELYRWHLGDPAPTCVSCGPIGVPPAGDATFGTIEPGFLGAEMQMELLSRNLSADGDRVFFETRDALVSADTNGDAGCPGWGSGSQRSTIKACQDVYEWEAKGAGSCETEAQDGGCLYLISSGKSDQASFFADADESGENAFVFTASGLVGQDEDALFDVYDARVGGGLASQNPPPPPVPCEAEACKGASTPPPPDGSPATAGFAGPGNVREAGGSCAASTRRAQKLARVAEALRSRARHARSQRQAERLRQRAARYAKRGNELSKGAKRCRRKS